MALTREPSTRRASTIGLDSSTRRPMGAMMRSMMRITWSSFWKATLVSSSLPRALDVDLARAVDHDLGDALVAQERLERAEADDLVGDLLQHPDALGAREGEALLVDDLAEDLLDLAADLDLVGQVELGVEVLDDPLLDAELGVPERLAHGRLREHPRRRARRWRGAVRRWAPAVPGAAGRPRLGSGPSALDPPQQRHRSTSPSARDGRCMVTLSPREQGLLLGRLRRRGRRCRRLRRSACGPAGRRPG